MITLIIFFLGCTLGAAEQPIKQHRSNFSVLPMEIINHIGSYLSFEGQFFETDDCFIKRIRKSQGMLQSAKVCTAQTLQIQEGTLLLMDEQANVTEKLINGGSPFIKYGEEYDFSEDEHQEVCFFNLSPAKNFCAAFLRRYTYQNASNKVIELLKYQSGKFIAEKTYNMGDITLINFFAISSSGQIALVVVDNSVRMVKFENDKISLKDITSARKKYRGMNELLFNADRIVDIVFNKQSTQLGIKFHFLNPCLFEKIHETDRHDFDEQMFRQLLQRWFLKYYKDISEKYCLLGDSDETNEIIDLLKNPLVSIDQFWTNLREILPDTMYKKVQQSIFVGNNKFSPIQLIKLQDEEPWTLEKYFRLTGVCKKFNQQCGLLTI